MVKRGFSSAYPSLAVMIFTTRATLSENMGSIVKGKLSNRTSQVHQCAQERSEGKVSKDCFFGCEEEIN